MKTILILRILIITSVIGFVQCSGDDDASSSSDSKTKDNTTNSTSASDDKTNNAGETFTDTRDNKKYSIKELNGNTWMLENYAYDDKNDETSIKADINGRSFGRAYSYQSAKDNAPDGWRLPTVKEWRDLVSANGSELVEGGSTGFVIALSNEDANLASCSKSFDGCAAGGSHYWAAEQGISVVYENGKIVDQSADAGKNFFFLVRYVKDKE